MQSYIFGNKRDIKEFRIEYLIFLKRLLPREFNSIPESLAITLFNETKKSGKTILETGIGASTIALFLGCYFNKRKLVTFEVNKKRISFIKEFIKINICNYLNIDINKYWLIKNINSTNNKRGISSLKLRPSLFYLDSNHNINHIYEEINQCGNIAKDEFCIIFDDMNFIYEKKNSKFIEMLNFKKKRIKLKKRNLLFDKNKILKTYIYNFLIKKFRKVSIKKSYFDLKYRDDLYNKLYGSDFFYNHISEIRAKKINHKKMLNFLKERILYVKIKKK